jgi:hypothetical protein
MTFKEVKERIREGDHILMVFYTNRHATYVERNGKRIFDITYKQYKNLTEGKETLVYSGGFTKHVTKY